MEKQTGTCRICLRDRELRHINLYVTGSEGLWICRICEIALVSYARRMMRIHGRKKLKEAKERSAG